METITPKISVLIPAYNAEAYIDECLSSVREQTLADIEIIVADDGSTDNTLQRAEAHAAVDGRIRLLRLSHRGVSPTRNALLAAAEGTYVGLWTATTRWRPMRSNNFTAVRKRAGQTW